MEACSWEEEDADLVFLSDASNVGLAFWSPTLDLAFVASIEVTDLHYGDTFFNEVLVVVSAIDWAMHLPNKPQHILLRTDSMNTVDIFHSLAAQPNYVLLLFQVVETMMDSGVDVRVVHIPGDKNTIADALSL